jgi:hypothetical protein
VERTVNVDVNVKSLVISRGINQTDRAGLHKVVSNNDVVLVGSDFDVVGSDGRLNLVRVIKALNVG